MEQQQQQQLPPQQQQRPSTEEEVFETPDVPFDDGGPGSSSSTTTITTNTNGSSTTGNTHPLGSPDGADPENVVPTRLDPDAAFEVFHGKRYETSSLGDLSGSIAPGVGGGNESSASKRQAMMKIMMMAAAGAAGGRRGGEGGVVLPPPETPVDRYLRLKAEMNELAEEVEALVAVKKEGEDKNREDEEASSLWQHLASELLALKGNLLALAEGPLQAKILSSSSSYAAGVEDNDITSIAAAQAETDLAEALVRKVGELTVTNSSSSSSSSSKQKKKEEDGGDKNDNKQSIVYELYYDGGNNHSSSSSSSGGGGGGGSSINLQRRTSPAQLQALEARLTALEKLLALNGGSENTVFSKDSAAGGGGGEGGGLGGLVLSTRALPLVEALAKVERQATLLDANAIETLRQRLVLLKAEWDDFKKERLKLANSLERDAGSHFRRVEALHEQCQRLAPLSGDLPQLVVRLRVLQELHGQSLRFGQRLGELEGGQSALRILLQGTAQSLAEMKESLQENVRQVEANVREVDRRLAEEVRVSQGQGVGAGGGGSN